MMEMPFARPTVLCHGQHNTIHSGLSTVMADSTAIQEDVLLASSSWRVVSGSWKNIVSTSSAGPGEGYSKSPGDVRSESKAGEVSVSDGSASTDGPLELEAADADCMITCKGLRRLDSKFSDHFPGIARDKEARSMNLVPIFSSSV